MTTMSYELPGPLRVTSPTPFVGRTGELALLRSLVPRSPGERRRIALVGGEAGSGKSRLAREFAQEVAASGVLVLYGACDAVVPMPFRPFVEALEQLLRELDPALVRGDLGPSAGELARLLPDLESSVGELPAPVEADPDTKRHRLHSAVAELLENVGRRQPILLVIEDGHWADSATLHLLRHLSQAAAGARVLVLATFRDTEADVPAELADALADLRRSDDVVRIALEGLNDENVAEFVRRASGASEMAADADLAAELRSLTEGNPFLLCELWRTLAETGAVAVADRRVLLTRPLHEIATPASVREVVNQRVSRLEASTRDLLELAAVAGGEFELELLARASSPGARVADALDEAARAGLIEELPAATLSFRFAHELVRRAVYDRLSSLRRAELHLLIGEALEAAGPPVGGTLPELAHHFSAAAPIGERRRAVRYNLLAADAATASLAFDEAADRLETALRLGIDDPRERAETELALGRELYRAGASLESLAAFRRAAEIARILDDSELLARAAIGFENTCWRPGLQDQGALALLEEAERALPQGDSSLRVRVLAGLARALDELHGDHVRGREVGQEATEMARRLDDRAALAATLVRAYWSDRPRHEVLQLLAEGTRLAAELGDIELEAESMEWRIATLMALGQIDAARRELAVVDAHARVTGQPFILHVAEHYASTLALLAGRLDQAEAAAERSREWGLLLTGRDASGVYGIQMFGVRREQGRLNELASVIRVLAASDSGGAWQPGYAAVLAELDMREDARRELARVRRAGLGRFRESLWLAALAYLTDASAAVGDAALAELVYPELAPLAGSCVMVGHGVALYGSADRFLGMLAAAFGNEELACEHFEVALDSNREMGATTWLAHTAYEYGRLLAAADPARAGALLDEADFLATTIGMPTLQRRVRMLVTRPRTGAGLPDDLSRREADVLELVARGSSNKEIGAQLHISEHTAANHVRAILRKTGAANRTEAAAYAYRHGLAGD